MDKTNVNYTLPVIAKKFKEYIEKNSLDFRDDRVSSVIDFLGSAYADNHDEDPQKIKESFASLDSYLKDISLDENNAVFGLVCNLCVLCEERAFKDGLQLGAYLMLELQGK